MLLATLGCQDWKKKVNKLIAGYHAGEFGHILMRWQGILRHMAPNYDSVVIGCEKSMKFLFEDFANEFMFFEDLNIKIHSRNMWMCNQTVYQMPHHKDENYFKPCKEICLSNGNYHQNFIKWGKKTGRNHYDLLIHARSTTNFETGYRNWPYESWQLLLDEYQGLKIASVGSKDGAWWIPGTKDLRGIPLKQLSNIMASSDLFASPSSGPGHFASLCGCKHLIWSDKKDRGLYDNEVRYKEDWNPFETECFFIPNWQPTVRQVIKEMDKCLYP